LNGGEDGGAGKVIADDRRSGILDFVRQSGTASGADLARAFSVSPVTIHRDLKHLAEQGVIERVRGGARATRVEEAVVTTDWTSRQGQAVAAKREIARVARGLIENGSTVFIDASTTCFALAREIDRRPPQALTIVTNSPAIAADVRLVPLHVIVVPGEVDQNLLAISGRWTEEFLGELNFSIAFISGAALSLTHGLTTMQRRLSDTLKAARARASRTVALVDSRKFDHSALLSIARLDELDAIITDGELPLETAERYRDAGVELAVASRPMGGDDG
jgi:DeoR family fructose operon transcriptional repressor